MHRTATACDDPKRGEGDEWFVRDEYCRVIHDLEKDTANIQPNHIVFTVLIPHKGLDMSRWHQFLVGVMSFEVDVSNVQRAEHPIVTLDMRLGARDNSDKSWKEIAKSREQREHNCKK
ncbi:wntless homolog, partial [Paramuricea clavata]